jgi:outer membrane immunogenic protein
VNQTGVAAGAGIALALTPNLTGRVEYLYYGFGDEGVSAATFGVPGSADLNINTVRVGINYMFGNLY